VESDQAQSLSHSNPAGRPGGPEAGLRGVPPYRGGPPEAGEDAAGGGGGQGYPKRNKKGKKRTRKQRKGRKKKKKSQPGSIARGFATKKRGRGVHHAVEGGQTAEGADGAQATSRFVYDEAHPASMS